MSKKHYIAIAAALRAADFGPTVTAGAITTATDRRLALAQDLAETFEADNVHFDRFRFIQAVMGD